ncbi:MAG: hypothetical protein HYT80_08005 [Euryarchaeota archaeon]|nr:hypothetical protein [Euryarchaeota archaeon]
MSTATVPDASTTNETAAKKAAYAPCAWGVFRGDRVSVAVKPGRAYVTATRGKDRVSVALDKKGVARLLELLGAADLGANGGGAQ